MWRKEAPDADRRNGDWSDWEEEALIVEGREQGNAKAAISECIEDAVRGRCKKQVGQQHTSPDAVTIDPTRTDRENSSQYGRKRKRVRGSSMTPE